MVPMTDAVHIPFLRQFLDSDRVRQRSDITPGAAISRPDRLVRCTGAVSPRRVSHY
jgi:hypothetical protein